MPPDRKRSESMGRTKAEIQLGQSEIPSGERLSEIETKWARKILESQRQE